VAASPTSLQFPLPLLAELFGGKPTMFESPLLSKMIAETVHQDILAQLKDRFETVPRTVTKPLQAILDEKKLRQLPLLAAKCPDLESFRAALLG
jgi:hypothetical protein